MAGDIYEGCYSCGSDCIQTQFCLEETANVGLPKHLNVKLIANPTFWGFGSNETNVLISGWAFFNDGHFDFFDGYDENHFATKTCGMVTQGPYANEQRPDVFYRSVYTPSGVKHYGSDGYEDGIERGGAEIYLVDQQAGQSADGGRPTSDGASCDDNDPTQIFKKYPENFGLGNKILFADGVYKNATGAWRLVDVETPNSGNFGEFLTVASVCTSGTPPTGIAPTGAKQSLIRHRNFLSNYDPFRYRALGDYPSCLPDGSVVDRYKGVVNEIVRNTGVNNLAYADVSYNGSSADALFRGGSIHLDLNGLDDTYSNQFKIIDLSDQGSSTRVFLAGTFGQDNFTTPINGSGTWVMGNSYDPSTCCSNFAYGVDNTYKRANLDTNYHNDFGRAFNNAKNLRQSNRFPENRFIAPFDSITPTVASGTVRTDKSYPSVDTDGTVLLDGDVPVYERKMPYNGPFFEVDLYDLNTRRDQKRNFEIGRNFTCATKRNTLDMFPGCITQTYSYNGCSSSTEWNTQRVPRLSFVYRGANFYDTCNFDSSGLPFADWNNTLPTNIDQLRSGLAGLEINMFINLDQARGAMIQPETPCDCENVDGRVNSPIWEYITSPITFPSFPKWDLYPDEYGCQEPKFQKDQAFNECGITDAPCCGFDIFDWACNVRQPYTTYGYMRSLCGQQKDDRMSVISNGFSQLIQQGNARNTTPGSGNNEPVYWEFSNPDVMFSGSAQGDPPFIGTGNYPFWGVADESGRLVAPYFNNILTTGTYNDCGTPVDFPYLSFDRCGTAQNGWPTDNVPFLIEIDHDDSCVQCVTPQMEETAITATLQGLDTKYSYNTTTGEHGFNYCLYKGVRDSPINYTCSGGWPGPCEAKGSGGIFDNFDDYVENLQNPYTGNTCSLADGDSVTLEPIFAYGTGSPIVGTGTQSLLLGYSTWNTANSFVKLTGWNWEDNFIETDGNITAGSRDGLPYTTYVSMRLACPEMLEFLFKPYPNPTGTPSGYIDVANYIDQSTDNNPIYKLFNPDADGIGCQHHYPSADSDLQLDTSFVLVHDQYADLFEITPEHAIRTDGVTQAKLQDYIRFDYINDVLLANNAFGCNFSVIEYGCKGPDVYGASGFVGCPGGFQCASGKPAGRSYCECAGGCCICGDYDVGQIPSSYLGACTCDCNEQLARIIDWNACDASGTISTDNTSSGCVNPLIKSVSFSGDFGVIGPIYYGLEDYDFIGYGPYAATSESACRWKSEGINQFESGVLHYINKPEKKNAPEGCGLTPDDCELQGCADNANVGAGLCSYPIPFPSGSQQEASGIQVNRRSCYPEIMLVSKVECLSSGYLGDGYKLHVSREYHTHDRTWQELKTPDGGGRLQCFTKAYGGYELGATCESIAYANPADSVTPAWNSGLPCLVSQPTGLHAGQDFLLTNKPVSSGDTLWNYYNLFYASGFSTGNGTYIYDLEIDAAHQPQCPTPGDGSGNIGIFGSGEFFSPVGTSGTLAVNARHSCLQDQTSCGAELYCNKMFFPRRTHAPGTIVTRFGSMQICTANANRTFSPWHDGYQDLSGTDLELETKNIAPFIDTCDTDIQQPLLGGIGIDDTELIVKDVLPLMGIDRNKFRYLNDVKSCIVPTTGCIPVWTHSDQSIAAGLHAPKTWANNKETSFTYYLQKSVASGVDECLLNPFKIMVDVDCCTSNIRRKNTNDDPTNLDYILTNIPSEFCGGMTKPVVCQDCDDTICGGASPRQDQPDSFTCVEVYKTVAEVIGTGTFPVDSGGSCNVQTGTTGVYIIDELVDDMFIVGASAQVSPDFNHYIPNCEPCDTGNCVTWSCCDGTTTMADELLFNNIVDVSGTLYITELASTGWAWECDGVTYLGTNFFSLDPAEDCCFANKGCGYDKFDESGCCQGTTTICDILSNGYAWSGVGHSAAVSLSDFKNYQLEANGAVHLNPECGCSAATRYQTCSDSNLLINLTQS